MDTMPWILFFVLLLCLGGLERRLTSLIRGLEAKVDRIAANLGLDAPATEPPEVRGLLQAGRKIEAIKVYREATGAGLAEAKQAVERIEATIRWTPPTS